MLVPEVYCSSLDNTKKFHIDLFGFSIKYERPEELFAYFTLQGADIMVEEVSNDSRLWLTAELTIPFGRGVNFQWDVIDVDRLYARVVNAAPKSVFLELETKSYRCGSELRTQKQFIAMDPDGYLFRFCTDKQN